MKKTLFISYFIFFGFFFSCSNNPYPHEKSSQKIFYTSFSSPPKDLDPQTSYAMADLAYLRLCYEPLVDYHYLDAKKLIPALAKEVPAEQLIMENGELKEVRYTFNLRKGVYYIDDPCFEGGKGREMTAEDFNYVFKRVSDPDVNCPIASQLESIKSFKEYAAKIKQQRILLTKELEAETGEPFNQNIHYIDSKKLYDSCGDFPGIEVTGKYSFDMILTKRHPQILYWLAMRFISAIPFEAVDYYNPTKKMKDYTPVRFNAHPVGTGCYRFAWDEFRKTFKVVLVKNENWWGIEQAAPTTRFPEKPYSEEDESYGYWTKERAGKPIAQFDRIEWYKEVEKVPQFGKFLQGFYDTNILPPEKMGEAISNQELSPKMKERNIKLNISPQLSIKYIGFNMKSDTLGQPEKFSTPELEENREKTLERNRKLRQALSLAVDRKEFIRARLRGIGMAAQSPLPPGLYGYDKNYRNPSLFQDESSLDKARKILAEAGYSKGIDPKTGKPLELRFTYSSRNPGDDIKMKFFIESWADIGIRVIADSNEYNIFQDKIRDNQFDIFIWGWHADYPDPENFLFLLSSETVPDPNYTMYSSEEFDFFFNKMKVLQNEQSDTWTDKETGKKVTMTRGELIKKCLDILAHDCPWLPVYHDVYFELHHAWMKNVKSHPLISYPYHYYYTDTKLRQEKRKAWNKAIIWPAFALVAFLMLFIGPVFITYFKERN